MMTMLLVFLMQAVIAQGVTTSALSGRVSDTKGETLPGATVVAVHTPSGTVYGTITGADGRYFIPSMRIGGPYTVTVSFVGYKESQYKDIFLALGTATNLHAILSETAMELGEVVVSGKKDAVFSSDRTGAATTIPNEAIRTLPSLSRSINDFTRLTPQASGRSFVGQDSRLNNITIDGSIFNNSFGLADQPGGRTGKAPIALDAIEEIQVSIAPYDVRQAGFVGAGINAVTKSGTNEFKGSAYFNNRNEKLAGSKANGVEVTKTDFSVNQFGANLGGPIIKNKLFFFASAEFDRDARPATPFRANNGGETVGGNITRVLRSDLDNLRTFLKEKFNYETGPYEGYNSEAFGDNLIAKLDYNISKNHKASLRYNYFNSQTDVLASNSSSLGFGNRRSSTQALNYQNTNYIQKEKIHSIIGEFNSVFGKLTNNLIIGYTYQNEDRGSRGEFFPLVEIQEAASTYISFGFEPFTPNNKLKYSTFQLQDNVTYFAGKHVLTGGVNLERFSFENVFFPGSQSVYVYNSLADWYTDANAAIANPNRGVGDPNFEGPVTLRRFQLRYSALPGGAEPVQPTKVTYAGAYVQDEFSPIEGLNITAGVRVDVPFFAETGYFNETVSNQTFIDRDKNRNYKLNTAKLPDPKPLFSPRLGFNYEILKDRGLQVRGGTGLFTGRPAFVWISNQIGNNGVLTGFTQVDNTKKYFFSPDPKRWIPSNPALPASYELAITDPNFKFPQIWRSNIAVDGKLPFDLIGTAEFIYTKEINGIGYFNANLPDSTMAFDGPDNRPRYLATRIRSNVVNAIVLDNQGKGSSNMIALSLERPFSNGFFAKASYAKGVSKNTVNPGSIAAGSYNNNAIWQDPNNAPVAFSDYDQPNRFFVAASYRKEYAGFGATQIGIFFEGRDQGRFSYIYSTDMNSDGNLNDLLYVPKDVSEMNFQTYKPAVGGLTSTVDYTKEQQEADFEAYIKQDKYLSSIRGKYTERNGAVFPWVFRADLNITQEFFVNVNGKRNTIQLSANIFNFGNLINDKWGVGYVVNNNRPVRYQSRTADNKPVYRMNVMSVTRKSPTEVTFTPITETFSRSANISDVWQGQIGIKYIFN